MINCIAIDDSPLALELLECYIQKISYLHLIKKCVSGKEAIKILHKEKIDLIFLDIHMPDLMGLDLLKSLKVKPAIIITTGNPKYAIEGFNMDVADYLLKPFSFERFKVATDKVYNLYRIKANQVSQQECIFIKSGYETV